MLDILTIASTPAAIASSLRLGTTPEVVKHYSARSGDNITAFLEVVNTNYQATSGKWGIMYRQKAEPFVPVERILSKKPYSLWIRNNRCAIPVNCFFSELQGRVFLVRVLKERLLWLGGIFVRNEQNPEGAVSILTTEAADVLLPVTDRMPVLFPSKRVSKWLSTEHMHDVMTLADNSGSQWFDYFEIDPGILEGKISGPNALKPISATLREMEAKKEMLDKLDLNDDRFNRNNSKGR